MSAKTEKNNNKRPKSKTMRISLKRTIPEQAKWNGRRAQTGNEQ